MTKKNSEMSSKMNEKSSLWRSPEDLQGAPEFSADLDNEKAAKSRGMSSETSGVRRRDFMALMGVSMVAAGLSGCIRKPVEKILPYARRPEEIVPGLPVFFATAANLGGQVLGLLVESQEGRPTKVEGNEKHPMSLGATDTWAQSSVLDLYDADRSQKPTHGGKPSSWSKFFNAANNALNPLKAKEGEGLALLVENVPSPTFQTLLKEVKAKFPKLRIFKHDPMSAQNVEDACAQLGVAGQQPDFLVDKADVLLGIDANFLDAGPANVRNSRHFAERRDDKAIHHGMNRLYSVEANFTVTGAAADHRLRVEGSEISEFLVMLADELLTVHKLKTPAGVDKSFVKKLSERAAHFRKAQKARHKSEPWSKWIKEVAVDLVANKGKSLVLVGEQQPARVHSLGLFVNALLENVGKTVVFKAGVDGPATEDMSALAAAIRGGAVEGLVMLGGNPVYTAPADLDFTRLLQSVPFSVHHSQYVDETSQVANWHVPANHYLESWGDLQSVDGSVAIQQPLIAPLYDTLSGLELLAFISGNESIKGYNIVRAYWKHKLGKKANFEKSWKQWLHDGVVSVSGKAVDAKIKWTGLSAAWEGLGELAAKDSYEVNFVIDPTVGDGRFANNPWLQELPDPMTKLTWENAVYISPKLAREKKLKNGHFVKLESNKKTLEAPVFIAPGLADRTLLLPLGYGRKVGRYATMEGGFDVNVLRTAESSYLLKGVSLSVVPFKPPVKLATTQEHGRLVEPITGRKRSDIVREADVETYKKDHEVIEKMNFIKDEHHINSLLWDEPNNTAGQQWGMVIDLNRCNGCNVCTIACQSENNIPVVGKLEVLHGREMSWIRLDRYYTGSEDNPQVLVQPMACAHCETAPCENVCPVAATAHSSDGMNDMAYNRCIGTRYCANNCPYKVRRFNYFNFNRRNDDLSPNLKMQRNPDVTVRFRGVMEKCSYCVQRINEARIEAKRDGNGVIPDGRIKTACGQACPSGAITFGDIADKNSRVSKLKSGSRNYAVLSELNTQPRTTYLAKIRNPNPKLG